MKTFIRAMGSELEHPAVREAAAKFDFIHTGHYGYKMLEAHAPELKGRAIVWFNPFVSPTYEGDEHRLQPSPKDMGMEKMPLVWDAECGHGGYAYDWTHPDWPGKFVDAVLRFKRLNPWARVLIDDWHTGHPWWTGMRPEHYERTLVYWSALVDLDRDTEAFMVNGTYLGFEDANFWEMFGRDDWHTLDIFRNAKPGDHIYCATGKWWHEAQAKAVAALKGCYVGIGLPDGERMTDEQGMFKLWTP